MAYPLHRETALALAVHHADGLAKLDLRTDSLELGPFAAYIDGKKILRESLSMSVGAEDTDGDFKFLVAPDVDP